LDPTLTKSRAVSLKVASQPTKWSNSFNNQRSSL
jgi:hypothetical protein